MNATHCTADDSASLVLGGLDGPDQDLVRAHLRDHCETCVEEMKEALEFWYVFAALTERTQDMRFPEPSPMLRERVIGITRRSRRPVIQNWLRIAAGVLVAVGAGSLSWNLGRYEIKRDMSAVQARADQQVAAAKKLESENNALRNLVEAARNAPAVFPGRESIVSVKDPYLLRDLQRARQTQVAAADALREERRKVADLEKRLSQTTVLLAAATHDKEETDRQYRKAFDAAMAEKAQGASRFSKEIATFHAKVQDLEGQIARYRAAIDAQNKGLERHLQMVSLLQAPNLSVVPLHGPGTGSAVALIADDSRLALFPANLPLAPAGRTYQLWLVHDKGAAMVSAGTFNGGPSEAPSLQIISKSLLSGVKGLTVTEEPSGGSPQPTGSKILAGTSGR